MSLILKSDNALSEQFALNMRGLQTDQFNEIKGGHTSLLDPLQQGITGLLVANDLVPSLVYNSPDSTVISSLASENVEDAKGFPFTDPTGGTEYINLPVESFNMLSLGSEPSVVISIWITTRETISTLQSIAGCTYQTGAFSQWFFSTGSNADTIRVSGQGVNYESPITYDVPELYSIYFERTGAGTMNVNLYKGSSLLSSTAFTYPFKDPSASPIGVTAGTPKLGLCNGFGSNWDGVVHRLQCFKVDPDNFVMADWLNAEVAGNTGRYDI